MGIVDVSQNVEEESEHFPNSFFEIRRKLVT